MVQDEGFGICHIEIMKVGDGMNRIYSTESAFGGSDYGGMTMDKRSKCFITMDENMQLKPVLSEQTPASLLF